MRTPVGVKNSVRTLFLLQCGRPVKIVPDPDVCLAKLPGRLPVVELTIFADLI